MDWIDHPAELCDLQIVRNNTESFFSRLWLSSSLMWRYNLWRYLHKLYEEKDFFNAHPMWRDAMRLGGGAEIGFCFY